jgi:hypothetical protein
MLKDPFNYDRANPEEHSIVEQKTLRELEHPEGLRGWKATGPREQIVPTRVEVCFLTSLWAGHRTDAHLLPLDSGGNEASRSAKTFKCWLGS